MTLSNLPVVGADENTWGEKLLDALNQLDGDDASLDDRLTTVEGVIASGNIGTPVTKASLGLSNVNNTADVDKPVSTAVAQALAAKQDGSQVKEIIVGQLVSNGSVALGVDPTSRVVTVSGPTSFRQLVDDVNIVANPTAGRTLAIDSTGNIVVAGRQLEVFNTNSDIPGTLPTGVIVLVRDVPVPALRYTLAHGAAGADVTLALEGYSADTANKLTYVTDRPSGVSGTTSAEAASGAVRYMEKSGLTDTITFGRYFFKVQSFGAGNTNMFEARSDTGSLLLLQLRSDGKFNVKNVASTVYTTTSVFTTGVWYRVDFAIGGGNQTWSFYSGNSGTLMETTTQPCATGVPTTQRLGCNASANSSGTVRYAAWDINNSTLATPWA